MLSDVPHDEVEYFPQRSFSVDIVLPCIEHSRTQRPRLAGVDELFDGRKVDGFLTEEHRAQATCFDIDFAEKNGGVCVAKKRPSIGGVFF